MPLETDLNVDPFWDDFDERKNYHKVLFRPRTSVQTRELNQLQTILQNQIERFGQNVYQDGTIIKGCSFTYDNRANYIKLQDSQIDGQPVNVDQYVGTILKNSSDVTATVVDAITGYESQNPDLKTLYVKYTKAGANNARFFSPSDVLTAYANNFSIQRIQVANSGINYSNGDIVNLADTTGTGATGRIVTDNSGRITFVTVVTGGSNYSSNVAVSITNSSGNTSNGSGAVLYPNTSIAQITVASNTFNVANNIAYSTVGVGYRFKVGEGVIFQKGFFTRVEPQSVIVSKYTSNPSNTTVGFSTTETVANANVDDSLYDNALGQPNYSAPGAFRLKLTPTLVVKDSNEASDSNTFFSVVSFENGAPIKVRQTTEFNTITTELARRTSEESGDYVVKPFTIYTDEIEANTTHIQVRVSSGLAYIDGYRVEQFNTSSTPVRRGTDTKTVKNVTFTTNYSNYVEVRGLEGVIPFNTIPTISLRDTVTNGAASAAPGNEIGTAKVRHLTIEPGANTYRLYLFDIRMSGGNKFSNVKSVYYDGGGSPNNGAADIVLESSQAVLQEPSFSPVIFDTGRKAVKTLKNESNQNNTDYTYATVDPLVSFTTAGVLQKNLTGDDIFPYTGVLNNTEEQDFIFIARNSANSFANGTGLIAYASGNNIVTGTSSNFLAEYVAGDYIVFGSGVTKQIVNIANNTSMTVDSNFASANTSTSHRRTYPANKPIVFTNRPSRTITVTGNQTVTATLGEAITNTLNVTAIYNVQRQTTQPLFKNFNSNTVVKISAAADTTGPWCLGIPDVTKLVSVTRTNNTDYVTNAVDVTSEFEIDNGQLDTHYGLGWLKRKANSSIALTSNDRLVVRFNHFTSTSTGGGIGFYTVDSYPIDDSSAANSAITIRTEQIPVVNSLSNSKTYDLRDCVDFRPVCSNTATITSNVALATVNPSSIETFTSTEKYIPAVNKQFKTDLQHYVGRYDIITLNSLGQRSVVEGSVSETPYPPKDVEGAMTIATISIPPYPSLPTKIGYTAKRPDYTTLVTMNQPRRYTMSDLGGFENRIQKLEYYTALSLLDKQTNDTSIPSAVDSTERFKNGIFVDSFANFNAANVLDGEFKASIDEGLGELAPSFEHSPIDLVIANTTNVQVTGDLVTLPYDHTLLMQQPYASVARNCVQNFWNFKGKVFLTPSYDNFYDVHQSPQNTVINVDATAGTLALVDELNKIRAINGVASNTSTSSSTSVVAKDYYTTTYETTTTTTTSSQVLSATTNTSTVAVGDFVTDISINPFIRSQPIYFRAYGLKPNAKVWVYFDKVEVTPLCQLCNYDGSVSDAGTNTSAWHPTQIVGGDLKTDATGAVAGIFYVPAGTFFTGDREFKILDINTVLFESAATSSAATTFHAYNYSVDKSNVVISTRSASVDTTTQTSTSTTTTRSTETTYVDPPEPSPPPLTQDTASANGVGYVLIVHNGLPVLSTAGWQPKPNPSFDGDIGLLQGYDIDIYTYLTATGNMDLYNDYVNYYYPNRAANCLVADPIAQTFTIRPEACAGQEGIFVSKLDLFFKQKDANLGVTVNLRLTENGYPSSTIVPFSEKHLTSSQVNVSEDSTVATTVVFDSPVFLKAGQEYAFVVQPDGNSPDYLIWASKTGETDIANPAITVRLDWGDGMLFTSTNNSAWSAVQDEDLKFTMYYAKFNTSSGSLTLTNGKDEFFSYGTANSNVSAFYPGEKLFKFGGQITGKVEFSSNSAVVTGVGTNFLTQFTPNSYIVLANTETLPSAANAATSVMFDVFQVDTIANNTSLTLKGLPKISFANAVALSTPIATVHVWDKTAKQMHLINSTANTGNKFAANDIVMGSLSNSWYTIDSLDDIQVSYYQPLLYRTAVSGTSIQGQAQFTNDSYVTQDAREMKFNDSNYITDFTAVIASYSKELDHSANKSVKIPLTLSTTSPLVSPVLDLQSASIVRYTYLINNDNTMENTSYGNLKSKYVSKEVTLKDGQDAEDLIVYTNAFRASGTEIDVYVRALNVSDPDVLSDKTWTRLTNTNALTYSSSANRNDIREFTFTLPKIPDKVDLAGTVTSNSTTVTGVGTTFTTSLAVGDTIVLFADENTYHVAQVTAIASNTSLTISEAPSLLLSSVNIAKFADNGALFRDPNNMGVLTYYADGAKLATYKKFALKVGLRSVDGQRVPRLQDLRAIALTV